ncbi:MAG: hemerythrin domain-containing protein [Promethearchaeota archaeon]|jgi:iron-sulfur cluster repair protein YtfE (RIC family)
MDQPRFDVYTPIHKAIRLIMTEIMYELGKSDANNISELKSIEGKLEDLWNLLEAHAEGEEEFIFPHLKREAESIFLKLKQAHENFEKEISNLRSGFREITGDAIERDKRPRLLSAFTKQYNTFLSQYFSHLQDEELEANPILWNSLSDIELMGIINSIVAKQPPELMQYLLPYYFKAINPMERAGLLMGMKKNMPEPAFDGVLKIAQASLEESDWQKLQQIL